MNKGNNVVKTHTFKGQKCVAALAVISNKVGLVKFMLKEKSIKQEDFI